METRTKSFPKIPIVAHNSEKPSFALEETSSGKIYPSIHTFEVNIKDQKSKNIKKLYKEIPVIAHDSNKPTTVIEEMNSIRAYKPTESSIANTKMENQSKNEKIINKKGLPILIHESEKPSVVFEEISSGKCYYNKPPNNEEKKDKKENQLKTENKTNKKGLPIFIHESEKPSVVFEEINSGKYHSFIQTSITNNQNENKLKSGKKTDKIENTKKEKNNNKKGKPIIIYESEKPSCVFEEIGAGKCFSNIQSSLTNYKNEKKSNEKKKDKKDNQSKNKKSKKENSYIIHESEKPSNVFEEINSGKCYSNKHFSITNYKMENKANIEKKNDKIQSKADKNMKKGKPIRIHESENPSIVFEEINAGKKYSKIPTSITNYKEQKKKVNKLEPKKKDVKKNIINKKYKDIPIISHDSENPYIVFEETNAGNKYKKFKTSVTEYKVKKTFKKSNIPVHESEKPSIVFEQNNSGKLFSNVETTETDYKGIQKLKKFINEFKEIPIVEHNSQKPSIVFEETNTGITLDFHHLE